MLERQLARFLLAIAQRRPIPVRVQVWDGQAVDLAPDPKVVIRLTRAAAIKHLLSPTLDSLGRAYVEGEIEVDGAIRDVVVVAEALAQEAGTASRSGLLPQAWGTRHTPRSDRKSIEYHYDVSNDFYRAWLDGAMVYSCAYFKTGAEDLDLAQQLKLEHICRKLRLAPGLRLLDIGCGWGALLLHAARHYGVEGVGITLSKNQLALARERAHNCGLSSRIEFRLQDYRELSASESFDRVSSIGMVEHVGLGKLGGYFERIAQVLRPGGVLLNHGISSSDPQSRSVGLGAGQFIDEYVFPNGELPHVALAISELSRAGLELTDAESLRRHYARTLWHWSDRFESQFERMSAMAGERRARVWRVYLAGCAHAFEQGWINIYQLQAVKPAPAKPADFPLPLTRDYLYRATQ